MMLVRSVLLLAACALPAACAVPPAADPQEPAARAQPATPAQPAAPPSPAEQEAMMLAVLAAGAPGPEHERLMQQAGDWSVKMRYRMDPAAPWTEGTATSKLQKALGGRVLVQKFSSTMSMGPGMDFQLDGLEITGFNNMTRKYESYWFDTMSTWCTHVQGVEQDGVISLEGLIRDPITPEGRPARFTRRVIDADHMFAEAFDTIPPHGEVKVMEMEFTRLQP